MTQQFPVYNYFSPRKVFLSDVSKSPYWVLTGQKVRAFPAFCHRDGRLFEAESIWSVQGVALQVDELHQGLPEALVRAPEWSAFLLQVMPRSTPPRFDSSMSPSFSVKSYFWVFIIRTCCIIFPYWFILTRTMLSVTSSFVILLSCVLLVCQILQWLQ